MQIKSSARSEGVYKMGSCAALFKPDTGVATQAVVMRTVEDVRQEELRTVRVKSLLRVPELDIRHSSLYVRRRTQHHGLSRSLTVGNNPH